MISRIISTLEKWEFFRSIHLEQALRGRQAGSQLLDSLIDYELLVGFSFEEKRKKGKYITFWISSMFQDRSNTNLLCSGQRWRHMDMMLFLNSQAFSNPRFCTLTSHKGNSWRVHISAVTGWWKQHVFLLRYILLHVFNIVPLPCYAREPVDELCQTT